MPTLQVTNVFPINTATTKSKIAKSKNFTFQHAILDIKLFKLTFFEFLYTTTRESVFMSH